MVIWTMMRILLGMYFRMLLMAAFEQAVTAMTARHMMAAVFIDVVTAKAEHMPRTCKAIGLLFRMALLRAFFDSLSSHGGLMAMSSAVVSFVWFIVLCSLFLGF